MYTYVILIHIIAKIKLKTCCCVHILWHSHVHCSLARLLELCLPSCCLVGLKVIGLVFRQFDSIRPNISTEVDKRVSLIILAITLIACVYGVCVRLSRMAGMICGDARVYRSSKIKGICVCNSISNPPKIFYGYWWSGFQYDKPWIM